MSNDKIVQQLCESVKCIEKEVSINYIGKKSKNEIKAFQKDAVGLIKSKLDELYSQKGDL